MTPLHPDLREALLNRSEHKKAGLTAARLTHFENLTTQYFYTVEYPDDQPIESTRAVYVLTERAISQICENWGDYYKEKKTSGTTKGTKSSKSRKGNGGFYCEDLYQLLDVLIPGNRDDFLRLVGATFNIDLFDEQSQYWRLRLLLLRYVTVKLTGSSEGIPRRPADIIEEIKQFKREFLPKFDEVHREWSGRQRKRLTRREFSLNPGPAFLASFRFLGSFLLGLFYSKRDIRP